ncbi:hypothetical protein KR222_009809, partial [Zaprionus bogoriensis]
MSTPQLQGSSLSRPLRLALLQLTLRLAMVAGFGINLMVVPDEDRSQVACTLALLRKYFNSGDSLSGSVLCVSVTPYARDVQEQLLRGINQNEALPWTVLTTRHHEKEVPESNMKPLHQRPQCYFLVVENLDDEDLEEIFAYWKLMLNWNPLAQFVVYLASVEETDEEMTDLMVELMLTFMNNKLYNVNVIGQSDENSFYYAKTVFPYHPDNNCGNRVIAVELLDACSYEVEGDGDEEDEEFSESTETENEQESNFDNDNEETEMEENRDSGNYATDEELDRENPFARQYANESNLSKQESTSSSESQPVLQIEQYMRARFEDKFPHDLSGCPIRAAYRGPWEPYIFTSSVPAEPNYAEEAAEGNDSALTYDEGYEAVEEYTIENVETNQAEETVTKTKLMGIEYQLIQTIAQQLNVDIDFKTQSTNVFHLFQQLIEGQIEMTVGGIDEDPSISQYVSSSASYNQDELTWCVAKAKRKHSFFNFLASFNATAWLLLLLFILASSLAVLAAQRVSGFQLRSLQSYLSICIRMLGILVTQAINVNAQKWPLVLRQLFALSFFMAFFFSNTYQSFLISTLTTPTTQAQISRLQEIYDNRMIIMVSSENVRHLDKQGEVRAMAFCISPHFANYLSPMPTPQIFRYIREKFQICYNIVDCLNQAADNERIAVAVSRQHAFYNPRIPRDRLFCFDRKESLYVYPVIMLLPKKYQLLHQINAIIHQVIESGHMQKWARDLDMVRMIQEKIARVQEDNFKALTLAEFQGAFAFASILLLLASAVFGLECLVHWMVTRRRTR